MNQPQPELWADNRPWADVALEAIYTLALSVPSFTADDVWAALGTRNGTRGLGSVMNRARANGWIVGTDVMQRSIRPECNARRIPVWRSLLIPGNVTSMVVTVKIARTDAMWLRTLLLAANAERGAFILAALDAELGG